MSSVGRMPYRAHSSSRRRILASLFNWVSSQFISPQPISMRNVLNPVSARSHRLGQRPRLQQGFVATAIRINELESKLVIAMRFE